MGSSATWRTDRGSGDRNDEQKQKKNEWTGECLWEKKEGRVGYLNSIFITLGC